MFWPFASPSNRAAKENWSLTNDDGRHNPQHGKAEELFDTKNLSQAAPLAAQARVVDSNELRAYIERIERQARHT